MVYQDLALAGNLPIGENIFLGREPTKNLGFLKILDYKKIKGLSNEHKEKLTRLRPETLGHAQRIDGVTPAALGLIIAHLKNNKGA